MAWIDRLLPGSFRGVPFYTEEHAETGGRRVAEREYPLRETPSTEDLGRKMDRWRIQAYVIQDLSTQDYIDARDALRAACRQPGPATLVHPYLGSVSVNCVTITCKESLQHGGMAVFDLEFIESGLTPSPTITKSTDSGLLGGLFSTLTLLTQAYAIGSLIAQRPGVLLGFAESYLGSLVGGLTGLPASVTGQITTQIQAITFSLTNGGTAPVTSAITGLTGDPVTIAISDAFAAAAQAVLNPPVVADTDDVTGVTQSLARMPADPTQGVTQLATWVASTVAPSGLQVPLQMQLQSQLTALVQACATIAIGQIYAGTTFSSSNAAAIARTNLVTLLANAATMAAAQDEDALYQGWLTVSGLAVLDLVARIQSLPSLTAYTTVTVQPACALAQLLLQDGTQADALVALNDAVHPSFMPVAGVYLPALT
jgi:prophage DNA circulation protein